MVRLLLISIAFFFSTQVFAADCGQFKVVKGNVMYKKQSKKKFKKARINKKVCQGDLVKTSANSRAKIIMADDNEINISPNTELLIEVYQTGRKAVLSILNGKVRSNVKRKYQDNQASHYRVKTKSAVAGVRGTEFMASYNRQSGQSKIVTFEGEVAVGQMQGGKFVSKVTVKPGQYTSSSAGSEPHAAKEVPPQELAQMDRESNVSDSPRDVSSESGSESAEKDDNAENEKNDDGLKKDKPKGNDKPKDQAGNDKPEGEGPSGNKGGSLAENGDDTVGNAPPGDSPLDGPMTDDSGSRDIASEDPLGLPPPSLDDMPGGDDLAMLQPPPVLSLDPIIDTVPECSSCNDAVVNQSVRVIIVPKLPGQ